MVISSPSTFTTSSTSSISGKQSDLHTCLRETEAFIQANSLRSAPGSLLEASPFLVTLGGGGMDLPAMRATSKGKTIAFDRIPAANFGKSVDETIGLGDANFTFGGLTASNFTSRVAGGEIMEGNELLECNVYDQGLFS